MSPGRGREGAVRPGPAGLLHIGAARVALANLVRRKYGTRILLRFDDTDPGRCKPEAADSIQPDLVWLGLAWDGVLRQSDRRARLWEAAARLRGAGGSIRASRAKKSCGEAR